MYYSRDEIIITCGTLTSINVVEAVSGELFLFHFNKEDWERIIKVP